MILLRYIIVYKDRLEIFINVLPLADSTEDLLITDEDLTTYGLLEPNENQKTADNDGFPSENLIGDPSAARTRDTMIKSHVLYRLS